MANYSPDRYSRSEIPSKDSIAKLSKQNTSKERAVDEEEDYEEKKDSVLKKYINRFRYCEPESRTERRPAEATDFWWKQVRSSIDSINEQINECARKRQQMKEKHLQAPIPKPDFSPPRHQENPQASRLQPLEKCSIEDLQSRAEEILEKNLKNSLPGSEHSLTNKDFNPICLHKSPHEISKESRYESVEAVKHSNSDVNDILTQWRLRRKMELARMHQDPFSKAASFHKVATDETKSSMHPGHIQSNKKDEESYCTEKSFFNGPTHSSVIRMVDAQTQASPKLHAGQISFTASRDSRCGPDRRSDMKSGSESFMVTSIEDMESLHRGRRRKLKRTKKRKTTDEDDRSQNLRTSRSGYNASAEEGNPRRLMTHHVDRDLWSVDKGRSVDLQSSTDFGSLSISARESRDLRTPVRATINKAISSHLFDSSNVRSSADSDSFFGCESGPGRRCENRRVSSRDQLLLTDVSEDISKSANTEETSQHYSTKQKPQENNNSRVVGDDVELDSTSATATARVPVNPSLESDKQIESRNDIDDLKRADQQNSLDQVTLEDLMSSESDNDFPDDSVLLDLRHRRQSCIRNITCLNELIESKSLSSPQDK